MNLSSLFITDLFSFFEFYRDVACTIYPVVPDTSEFESKLEAMLRNRAISGGIPQVLDGRNEKPFGVSLSWLGLLFAVLASGSQCSTASAKERELTSQVYSRCLYRIPCCMLTYISLLRISSTPHDQFHDSSVTTDHSSFSYHWQCTVI